MRKSDFDFKQYVEVPEEWIEKALAIPDAAPQKPKVIPMRRYVAAASVVLIAVTSVTVYFLFRNKVPIPIAQNPTVSTAETTSEETAVPTRPCEQNPTFNTDGTVNDQTSTSSQAIPTQPATQIMTDSGRQIVIPTSAATISDPTEAPSSAVTAPPSTEPPQSPYTDTPTQKPVINPTTVPPPTSAPVTQKPTTYQPKIKTLKVYLPIIAEFAASDDEDDTVYCCVYDSSGNPLGDRNLYSNSHCVDIMPMPSGESYESQSPYCYTVEYDANRVPDNRFTYKLYLRNGTVLYEGTVKG